MFRWDMTSCSCTWRIGNVLLTPQLIKRDVDCIYHGDCPDCGVEMNEGHCNFCGYDMEDDDDDSKT